MTQNEIARRLQRAIDEYTSASLAPGTDRVDTVRSSLAGHSLVVTIGYLILDIDADVEHERQMADERERMTPVAPHWLDYGPVERDAWRPVPDSPHNSLNGE